MRDDGRAATRRGIVGVPEQDLPFLLEGMRRQVRGGPGEISASRRQTGTDGAPAERRRVYVPHASRGSSNWARRMSEVRHGARADNLQPRDRRGESRAGVDAASIPSEPASRRGAIGSDVPGSAPALDRTRARDARGAVGRLAAARARLGFAGPSQPEYVHADRDRHPDGVPVQRRRDSRAGHFSRVDRKSTAACQCISSRPP